MFCRPDSLISKIESGTSNGLVRALPFQRRACLDGKRRPATTGGLRVRVPDDELRSLQVFLVVDLGSHQILHAHGIDQQHHALVLNLAITVFNAFVKGEAILEPGAAAARNKDPQFEIRIVFFG